MQIRVMMWWMPSYKEYAENGYPYGIYQICGFHILSYILKLRWCLSVCLSVQVPILVSGPRRTNRTRS
jgi:hypothetical protein